MYSTYILIAPPLQGGREILNKIENRKFESVDQVKENLAEKFGLNIGCFNVYSMSEFKDLINANGCLKLDGVLINYVQIKAPEITRRMVTDAKQTLAADGYIGVYYGKLDIVNRAEELGHTLTDQQIKDVASVATSKCDHCEGINWDSLGVFIDQIVEESKNPFPWKEVNGNVHIQMPGKLVTVTNVDEQITELEGVLKVCDEDSKGYYTLLLQKFKQYADHIKSNS